MSVLSCRQNNSLIETPEVTNSLNDTTKSSIYKEYIFDTSRIAIVEDPSHPNFGLKLTNTDLRVIDSLLVLAVGDDNSFEYHINNPNGIRLTNYKRQYSPFLNSKREKIVSIQCFCKDIDNSDYWKKNLLQIMDGGTCVFGLDINLTKKTYNKITIHGSA